MSEAAAGSVLRDVLGPEAVQEHDAVAVEGRPLGVTLRPTDAESLAAGVRVLAERGWAALVRGGGSRLGLGNRPDPARVLLSTEALVGIDELDADEGVLHARAGTRLAELDARVRGTGWELPLDPPGARSTLGGTLAAAAVGPRHLGYGRPRDLVLGLEVVLGDGIAARCGGRVVKNVTGYDLMKLHVGALGTLGVISGAWLRLRPAARCARVVTARLGSGHEGWRTGLEAARLASARAVALVDAALAAAVEPSRAGEAGTLLVAELAGPEAVVRRDAAALAQRADVAEGSAGALARLRALQATDLGPAGIRFRIAARASRLAEAAAPLRAAGAALLAHPGTGLLFACFSLPREPDDARAEAAWAAARRAAAAGHGSFVAESAPLWAKQARDVFGPPAPAAGLARALKQRFDPGRVLNPGRFAGRL